MVRKVLNIIGTVILIILIIIVVVVFYARATNHVPELFGFQLFRVSSGSMSPNLEIGDVILSHRVPISDIHEGDIITYTGETGDLKGKLITHMVIKEPSLASDGGYVLQTQGTAEGTVPDEPIKDDQIIGKYIRRMSFLNGIYSFFITPKGLIVFIAIIIILFAYEMISLIISYKSLDQVEDALSDESKDKAKRKNKNNNKKKTSKKRAKSSEKKASK